MAHDDSILNLSPISSTDRAQIAALLDQPNLKRRSLSGGIKELHPVGWTKDHKTFGVRLGDELFGAVHLVRDEDDRSSWELSVILADHKRALDGARSAVAAIFYAYAILRAQNTWFWAPATDEAIRAFATQLGYVELNEIAVPGATVATTYELSEKGWRAACEGALDMFLVQPVRVSDHHDTYLGTGDGFDRLSS